MVEQHKKDHRKKQKGRVRRKSDFDDETPEGDRHVTVVNTETNEVLKGDEAPTADQLEEWLINHPGYVSKCRHGKSLGGAEAKALRLKGEGWCLRD